MAPFPSRDRATTAILGQSSNGWSSTARTPEKSTTPSSAPAPVLGPGSAQKAIPEHRANLGSLRSHGYVSNSVFKSSSSPTAQVTSSPHGRGSPQVSNHGSPASRSAASTRFGFGLGISANGNFSPSKGRAVNRSASNSSMQSAQSTSDAENETDNVPIHSRSAYVSPRKSQGIQRLQKASYVTHSPFRRTDNEEDVSVEERAHEMPEDTQARSAVVSSQSKDTSAPRPSTPERTPLRTATARAGGDVAMGSPTSFSTPRGTRSQLASATRAVDSPTGRGLLVNNRLHGPRTMSSSSPSDSQTGSASKQERRKTVTFDEILDVQEFDRDSSCGHETISESNHNMSRDMNDDEDHHNADLDRSPEMWLDQSRDHGADQVVDKLMVVNGSPESDQSPFPTPELNHQIDERMGEIADQEADLSSADSRDEPQSPAPEDASFNRVRDKDFNEADGLYNENESDISGGHMSAYAATHRVDNLVDELLSDELLGDPKSSPLRRNETSSEEIPQRRRHAGPIVNANDVLLRSTKTLAKPLPSAPEDKQDGFGNLQLNLPEWSPLLTGTMTEETVTQETVTQETSSRAAASVVQPPAISEQSRPQSGRPHISRDAILQRVAREKRMQQENNAVPLQSDASKRAQLPAIEQNNAQDTEETKVEEIALSHKALQLQESLQAASAPKPIRQATDDAQRSPLERLTAEVATEQAQAAEANIAKAAAASKARDADVKTDVTSASVIRQQTWFANTSADGSVASDTPSQQPTSPTSPQLLTPAQQAEQIIARRRSKNGRAGPSSGPVGGLRPRRSVSDGNIERASAEIMPQRELPMSPEAEDARIAADAREEDLIRQKHMLDSSLKLAVEPGFESNLEREISRIYRQGNEKYHVNDRGTFASSSSDEQITRAAQAGDVDNGKKAWRKLRRPSDMNEYAKEMREIRAKENPKKATGKVFVLVDSFTPTSLPVPNRPTRFYCVLDNGLHVVRTATASLRADQASRIGQEFELIQHKNLEFSLTLVVQRDAHLHEPQHGRDQSPNSKSKGFVGKLFGSPKKKMPFSSSTASTFDSRSGPVEPMIGFLNQEGAFGQCNVVFEKIAHDCLAKCHTFDLPVRGVSDPPVSSLSSASSHAQRSAGASNDFSRNLGKIRGTLRIKVFYLPPLPGLAKNLLPDNLNDCIKGMEAARWHSGQPWKEGTLTQLGGDCRSWRRRPVKLQGANLICYNEITKKAIVKIDLSKADSVEENLNPVGRKGNMDDDDGLDEIYHVERSFRVTFKDGERISFFADTDAEMRDWMSAMGKIVGNSHLPQQCIWGQMALELLRSAQAPKTAAPTKADSVPKPSTASISSQPMSAAPSSSSSSTTSSSPLKRVPVPPMAAEAGVAPAPQRQQMPQSRSRPLSMATPQLSAVREVSMREEAGNKPEGRVSSEVMAGTSTSPCKPEKSHVQVQAQACQRPRPQSMYGMPHSAAHIAARIDAQSRSPPEATATRLQQSMQNGSPVRKLPIPSGVASAAQHALPSRPLPTAAPASTPTSPMSRSQLPSPPVERPASVYVEGRS